MRRLAIAAIAALLAMVGTAEAKGKEPPAAISITTYSQRTSASSGSAGAAIHARRREGAGRSDVVRSTPARASRRTAASVPPDQVVVLRPNDPLVRNPHPGGPGSFWYQDPAGGNGACIFSPRTDAHSSPACFVIAPAGGNTADVAALARRVLGRMDFSLGSIEASPSAQANGLTGAQSWFWLDREPRPQSGTVALGPERVTVTVTPSPVTWLFGDGERLSGSAGVPYQPGLSPASALTHVYRTRCLAGDAGRDPYVLGSCGSSGYALGALVTWTISFVAAGPVAESGSLPAITTRSELAYPVSEARGFLQAGASR